MSSLSTSLRQARKQRRLSQAALGQQIGVSQAQISQWENEKSAPSDEQLAALRAALGPFDAQAGLPLTAPAEEAPPKAAPKKKKRKKAKAKSSTTGTGRLEFEDKLWQAADLLRNNVDPAEYKHVILGLIFLKYISDAFEAQQEVIRAKVTTPGGDYYAEDPEVQENILKALLEQRDSYTADRVFWVPPEARWGHIQANAKSTDIAITDPGTGAEKRVTIGGFIDHVMDRIERENDALKGILPKIYGRPGLDQAGLGKLVDLFSGVGLGSAEHRARDTLGRVYEYFLGRFASAEGKGGGEFYTPASVVRLLVEMLEPYRGRVYDPCCGSGGMFVQSLKFIEAHGGRKDDISVFGQESNRTTWRLGRMNLAIRGIEANLGPRHADAFREDLHPDLRADFILANPPFNISQWHGEQLQDDKRWEYGKPPAGNANYAWIQHFLFHLAPGGTAGFVMANGSMSSMSSGEGDIRQAIVEADCVDCIVALPGQLFYSTQIPVCLWFLTRDKAAYGRRKRNGETLFIDARTLGRMDTRVHKVLDDDDIARIADTYHAWRTPDGGYADEPGFCKAATIEEIKAHDFVLTPGRYVGAEQIEDDGEPFEEKMERLVAALRKQQAAGQRLDSIIWRSLQGLGL